MIRRAPQAADAESQPQPEPADTELRPSAALRIPEDWPNWCELHSSIPENGVRPGQTGTWELTRRFGMPTGLAAGQQVWLVIAGEWARPNDVQVWLNQQALQADRYHHPIADSDSESQLRFSVRPRLLARNELRLVIPHPESDSTDAPPGRSIYLEIDSF